MNLVVSIASQLIPPVSMPDAPTLPATHVHAIVVFLAVLYCVPLLLTPCPLLRPTPRQLIRWNDRQWERVILTATGLSAAKTSCICDPAGGLVAVSIRLGALTLRMVALATLSSAAIAVETWQGWQPGQRYNDTYGWSVVMDLPREFVDNFAILVPIGRCLADHAACAAGYAGGCQGFNASRAMYCPEGAEPPPVWL